MIVHRSRGIFTFAIMLKMIFEINCKTKVALNRVPK